MFELTLEDHITPQEAARMLGCTPRHARRLATTGRLLGVRLGNRVLLSRLAVEAYVHDPCALLAASLASYGAKLRRLHAAL